MTRYLKITLVDGARFILRVTRESPHFVTGIEVDAEGDEIVPRGLHPKLKQPYHNRERKIDRLAVKKAVEMRMNPTYATLEAVSSTTHARKKSAAQLDADIAEAMSTSGFNRYRHLPPDETRGNPLHTWGQVHANKLGSYWTVETFVLLNELAALRPVIQTKARLKSVTAARMAGTPLPVLELGVFRDGSAWIVDGNHRLIDAHQAKLPSIPVTFTFVGT